MKYEFDDKSQRLTIELDEDIDMDTCRSLRTMVDGYIIRYEPIECEMNFEKVKFMDSSGLGFIMGRYNLAKMLGCKIVLRGPDNSIKKLLSMSDVGKSIRVV